MRYLSYGTKREREFKTARTRVETHDSNNIRCRSHLQLALAILCFLMASLLCRYCRLYTEHICPCSSFERIVVLFIIIIVVVAVLFLMG